MYNLNVGGVKILQNEPVNPPDPVNSEANFILDIENKTKG
jgi:hypothetical protein